MSESDLQQWVGRQQTCFDTITTTPLQALAATLNWEDTVQATQQTLPAPWHWLYFLPLARACDIDSDGHPKRGGFLPPVSLPRRMWAGSRMDFHAPLRPGDNCKRVSTIKAIKTRQGRTGQLVFVTVLHEIYSLSGDRQAQHLAISEEQDIVYRQASNTKVASAPATLSAPAQAQWSKHIHVDPVLLFRYSALTFNGHRIHYDRNYAIEHEGYQGLVVQGPLTATLLLDLLRHNIPDATLKRFEFRGIRALTDNAPFVVAGRCDNDNVQLWAQDADGALTMQAQATLVTDTDSRE